jgi:hypothetical protein
MMENTQVQQLRSALKHLEHEIVVKQRWLAASKTPGSDANECWREIVSVHARVRDRLTAQHTDTAMVEVEAGLAALKQSFERWVSFVDRKAAAAPKRTRH